jgi:hypothetical protein
MFCVLEALFEFWRAAKDATKTVEELFAEI